MTATHHIIVEVLQHTTSPLTSALTIFFTYKVSHIPKMRVYIRASTILFNVRREARRERRERKERRETRKRRERVGG